MVEQRAMKLVLAFIVAAVAFNTYVSVRHLLDETPSVATSQLALAASHAPPPAMRGASSSSPYGYFVPEGDAVAMPSVQISAEEDATIERKIYGGRGDKAHLGGFTSFDAKGVVPSLWAHMVNHLGIKSVLDVGCGRGISTSWFVLHGLEYVGCVEGSHDAVTQSLLPTIDEKDVPEGTQVELVEHDFSRGPWWPDRTVDAIWCVEFTEHVGRNYQPNYLTAWKKAGIIFFTHSLWGGWHHVEVHENQWWITRMEAMGFVYSDILTQEMKQKASEDRNRLDLVSEMKPREKGSYNVGQHVWGTLLVFLNPLVASRPEHAHLFAEHGCNHMKLGKGFECGKPDADGRAVQGITNLTPLPERFLPLPQTKDMDDKWFELIKDIPLA